MICKIYCTKCVLFRCVETISAAYSIEAKIFIAGGSASILAVVIILLTLYIWRWVNSPIKCEEEIIMTDEKE